MLAGASMGAHTLVRFALEHPARAAGLVSPRPPSTPRRRPARARALGRARRRPARAAASRASWRPTASPACPSRGATVLEVLRQRLAAHEHPEAVADALHAGAALAPVRHAGRAARDSTCRRSSWPAATRPTPAPVRVGEAYADDDPRRASACPRSRAARRWRGRAASSRRSSRASRSRRRPREQVGGLLGHAAAAQARDQGGLAGGGAVRPDGFDGTLGALPDGVTVRTRARGPLDVIVFFTTSRAALERRITTLRTALDPAGRLWVAWPKRTSGVATDVTEDVVREIALAHRSGGQQGRGDRCDVVGVAARDSRGRSGLAGTGGQAFFAAPGSSAAKKDLTPFRAVTSCAGSPPAPPPRARAPLRPPAPRRARPFPPRWRFRARR